MSTVIIRSLRPEIASAPPGPLNGDLRLIKVVPQIGVDLRFAGLLPERVITNDYILNLLQLSGRTWVGKKPSAEWPLKRTLAQLRHWCDPQVPIAEYIKRVCDRLFVLTGQTISDMGLILDASVTCRRWPSNVSLLLEAYGQPSGTGGFKTEAACGSGGSGLYAAITSVISGFHPNVLVTAEDVMAEAADLTDLSTAFLFGDGFSSTFARAVPPEDNIVWYIDFDTIPALNPHITSRVVPAMWQNEDEEVRRGVLRVAMNGQEVQKFVQWELPAYVAKALELTGLKPEDFAGVVPHQANGALIETFFFGDYPKCQNLHRRGIHFTREQVINNFWHVGNTTSPSVILGLMELWVRPMVDRKWFDFTPRRLVAGDKIMLIYFGGGGVVIIIVLEWPKGYPEPEYVPWARELADELFASAPTS